MKKILFLVFGLTLLTACSKQVSLDAQDAYLPFANSCLTAELGKNIDSSVGEKHEIIPNGRPFPQVGNFTVKGNDFFCEISVYKEFDEDTCAVNCWTNLKDNPKNHD